MIQLGMKVWILQYFLFKLIDKKMKLTIQILLFFFVFFGPKKSRKIVYEKDCQYDFYVSYDLKHFKPDTELKYYWYKNQSIKSTKGTYNTPLLHGQYRKEDREGNLIELGRFDSGLKDSIWTYYDKNGLLTRKVSFKQGLLHGKFLLFEKDTLVEKGKYKQGAKNGKWIYLKDKDTLFYNKNEKFIKKIDTSKTFVGRIISRIFGSDKIQISSQIKDSLITSQDSVQTSKTEKIEVFESEKKQEIEVRKVNGKKRRFKKKN